MSDSTTYKQEVKEKSRVEIWSHAVKKLTIEREHQRILNPNYVRRLWDYAFDEILPDSHDFDIEQRYEEDGAVQELEPVERRSRAWLAMLPRIA